MEESDLGEFPEPTIEKVNEAPSPVDKFEAGLDIPEDLVPIRPPSAFIEDILNMDWDEIKGFTAAQCAEKGVALTQYVLWVQREYNRAKSAAKRIERNIEAKVGRDRPFLALIMENETASKLETLRVKYQQRVDWLEGMSKILSGMVDQLTYLGKYRHSETFR